MSILESNLFEINERHCLADFEFDFIFISVSRDDAAERINLTSICDL